MHPRFDTTSIYLSKLLTKSEQITVALSFNLKENDEVISVYPINN